MTADANYAAPAPQHGIRIARERAQRSEENLADSVMQCKHFAFAGRPPLKPNVEIDRRTPEPRSGSFGGRPRSMKC